MAESANLLATYKLVFANLAFLEIVAKRKKVNNFLSLFYSSNRLFYSPESIEEYVIIIFINDVQDGNNYHIVRPV